MRLREHVAGSGVTLVWVMVAFVGAAPAAGQGCGEVDLQTHSIYRCVSGGGPVTFVLAAGAGLTSTTWETLALRLSGHAQVVTFDRAGLGRSSAGPLPRTPSRIAAETHAVLDSSGIEGPLVLVGHSMGGVHMLRLAERLPERVRGVVLVDTPPRSYERARLEVLSETEREERLRTLAEGAARAAPVVRHEREGAREEADLGFEAFPRDAAFVVIAANGQNFGVLGDQEEHRQLWVELSRGWLDVSDVGRFVVAEGSGHMVHRDQLELVESLIVELAYAGSGR